MDKNMEEEEKLHDIILCSLASGHFTVTAFRSIIFGLLKSHEGRYLVNTLLQAQFDVSFQIYCESTPEQMRSRYNQLIQMLVNLAENRDFYDGKQRTVLHFASSYGWLEIVKSLLNNGADPNAKETDGYTPIMLATEFLHKDVVDLLVESGADVLCSRIDNYTLLHIAASKGWLEFVQFLLDIGADPNATNIVGFTPLHLSVLQPEDHVVTLLIKAGANISSINFEGLSVLHFAVKRGCLKVVKCLVEKGADVNDKRFQFLDFKGVSPLFIACWYNKFDIIEYLVKAVNLKNGTNNTPLNFIIRKCPKSLLVKTFIRKGGYLKFIDYYRLVRHPVLKRQVLTNAKICTQAIINKFNSKDLPDFYKLPLPSKSLPRLKHLKIKRRGMINGIEEGVRNEIETKGYCNLMRPKVITLSILAVKSYIDYYNGLKKKPQLKRRATSGPDNQSPSTSKTQCCD